MSDSQDKITGSIPAQRQDLTFDSPRHDPVLKVEYTLTLEDAIAFLQYHSRHARQGKGQPRHLGWLWLVLLGLVSFLIVTVTLAGEAPALTLRAWGPVLLFVVYAFFYRFGNKLLERQRVRGLRRNPRFFDKRTLALSPEALTASDQSAANTVRWHAVERIIEQPDHAFFYISQVEAFILPKRAFADERQFEEFVDTARRYHAEARRFVRTEGQA
jgi:hypothetical protein